MSDTEEKNEKTNEKTNDKKESVIAKLGGWFGIMLALLVAMFLIDQGEVFERTLPAAWTRLKQVIVRGGKKVQMAYWQSAIWLRDGLKWAKRVTLAWWATAGIFLVCGMASKTFGWGENGALALRLVGIYLFAGYWFVVAMFAKPLYYGVHALTQGTYAAAEAAGETAHHWLGKLRIDTPVPEFSDTSAEKIEAGATAFQRFFFTIASLVLLFGTFFAPSGEPATAVKLMIIGMPLAAVAGLALSRGWKSELGWKLIGVAVLIAFVLLALRIFVRIDVLEWFSDRNQSELIAMALLGIPAVLWLMAAFWKSKADALSMAAKRLSWISAALLVFLWIKGPISSKELTGHETTVDEVKRSLGMTKSENHAMNSAPSGTYMAPPAGVPGGTENRSVGPEAPTPQAEVQTRIHRKIAVPSDEAPKEYTNPGQVLNDLDDLGY